MAYLKTLLYGYAICSLKEAGDTPWFTLNAAIEYYDTFEQLAIRDGNYGGAAKSLVLQADLVLRTELSRLNDATITYHSKLRVVNLGRYACSVTPPVGDSIRTPQPTLSGDELLATVLTSHSPQLPTHTAIVEANKSGFVANPKSWPFTKTPAKTGDLCRLYAEGKCRWGDRCKHVLDERSRNASTRCDPLVTIHTSKHEEAPRKRADRTSGQTTSFEHWRS